MTWYNPLTWFNDDDRDHPPLTEVAPNDGVMRRDVYDRCKQHPVGNPEEHTEHDAFWTRASGVFYCRDCESWLKRI